MSGNGRQAPATSPAEWCLAAFSGLLLIGLIGYLGYIGITRPSGAPALVVEAGEPQAAPGGFVVEFIVRNEGLATAANVQVIGELRNAAGEAVEEAEASLDYVPEGSTRRGWFHFTRDPGAHVVVLRPGGQAEP